LTNEAPGISGGISGAGAKPRFKWVSAHAVCSRAFGSANGVPRVTSQSKPVASVGSSIEPFGVGPAVSIHGSPGGDSPRGSTASMSRVEVVRTSRLGLTAPMSQ